MINTIYSFNSISYLGYTIDNIFEKNIVLDNTSVTTYSDWFGYTTINDGSRLDSISYNIYGSPNMWDVLFILNDMYTVFDLPKSTDYIFSVVESRLQQWIDMFPNTSADRLEELRGVFTDEETVKNEKNRTLRYLLPQYLPRFKDLINA